MPYLKLVPAERIEEGEIGIDQFDAWSIIIALKHANPSPQDYWRVKFKQAKEHLLPFFAEQFEWSDELTKPL